MAFGAARERSPRITSNKAACSFPYARVATWARPAIRASASPIEGNRALDLAQRPQCEREIEHRRDAGVVSEAEGQIVVAAGLEQGERAFQMLARFAILSGEPMRDPSNAVSDAGLRRIGSRLDVAEEGLGACPHRRQLAAHVAADPQAVVGRQSLGRVLFADRRLAGSGESFRRFRRAVAARRDERVAIGDVQLRRRCRCAASALTSSVSASAASSACASAISGISGVGEKPSSAGARTAWASAGRAVDW